MPQENLATDEEHVENPCSCPRCSSDQVTGGSFEVDGTVVQQERFCNDCGYEYYDLYSMTGWSPAGG